jgi:hypothetical protein
MHDRVGTLALRVRTDLEGRELAVRDLAERFTRDVIERSSQLLDARHPGRIVMLKTLPLAFTLAERDGTSPGRLEAATERAAEELAASIEASLPTDASEPSANAEVAVFADEAAFVASVALAQIRGTRPWFHEHALREDVFERFVREPALALAALVRLADRDRLIEVVAKLPTALAGQLVERLLGAQSIAPPAETDDGELVARLVEQIASWPALEPSARRLATYAYAHQLARASGIADARIASSTARALAVNARDQIALEPAQAIAATRDQTTAYVGLFYLVSTVLELGIAEALWQACLPEGVAIAHALAGLIGGADAALDVIAREEREPFAVTDDQIRELACATLNQLVSTLPRGGRAELPDGYATFVDGPRGRLLIATACDAPFVMFAQPARTPAEAAAALAALRALWPQTTPLFGAPSVIELDRSGQVRHARARPPAPFLVDADKCAAVALGSLVVGAACQLVASRVGDRVDNVAAWVAQRLALAGRIVHLEDAVEIWIDADAVDIELRAAGIDRDPGFVPWLATTIRLRFEA